MRFTYDDEADALYIHLSEGAEIERSIEVLGASDRVDLNDIAVRFHLRDRWHALGKIEQLAFRRATRA